MNRQRIFLALLFFTLVWTVTLIHDHSRNTVILLPSIDKVNRRPENIRITAPVVDLVLPSRLENPKTANEWSAFFRSGGLKEFSYGKVRLDTETLKAMGIDSKIVNPITHNLRSVCLGLRFAVPIVTQLEESSKLEYEPATYDPTNLGVTFGEGTFFKNLSRQLSGNYSEALPMINGLLDAIKHDPLFRNFGREKLVVTLKDSNYQNGKRYWEMSERVYDVEGNSAFERTQFTLIIPSPYDRYLKVVDGE